MNVRKGFTLIEMLVAVAVMSLTITAAVGLWIFFMYKTHRARTQAELDMDVRNVIERFRTEVRNTARETIVFYPGQREPYEAVSFALAADDDGDGLMDMDAGGTNILWRQTVVTTSGTVRRTRCAALSSATGIRTPPTPTVTIRWLRSS